MDIYIYSDESGVLDKAHNDFYVFGGVMFLSKSDKDAAINKYLHAENALRSAEALTNGEELKACRISNKAKSKLYRSLNQVEKFGIVVRQQKMNDRIFEHKKTKQRYLDWAFKMAVRRKFEDLIAKGRINPSEVERLYFFIDEHTTATNGTYELHESLEREFKIGTYSNDWMVFHSPVFVNLKELHVQYCNSESTVLVRAADIVANRLYYMARNGKAIELLGDKFYIIAHPRF